MPPGQPVHADGQQAHPQQFAEQLLQAEGVHGLDEEVVEPGRAGPLPVGRAAEPGHRDQRGVGPVRPAAQVGRQLVPVHPGQAQVEQDAVWRLGQVEGRPGVVGHVRPVPPQPEKERQAVGRVPVVIHHE